MKRKPKNAHRARKYANAPADLTGMRFGKWLVLKDAGMRVYSPGGRRYLRHMWLCRCDCGTQQELYRGNLTGGRSTRCRRCRKVQHGVYHTQLYYAWTSMKRSRQLPREWREFDAFRKAVGEPPSSKAHLRRYDRTKPHSAENTLWATPAQLRQIRKKFNEESVVHHPVLMKIRNATSKDEMIRCMVAARKAGYSREMLGIAAGLTHQRVYQILAAPGIKIDECRGQ